MLIQQHEQKQKLQHEQQQKLQHEQQQKLQHEQQQKLQHEQQQKLQHEQQQKLQHEQQLNQLKLLMILLRFQMQLKQNITKNKSLLMNGLMKMELQLLMTLKKLDCLTD
jgi:hypothetical protein